VERTYFADNVEVTGLLPDTEYLFRVCAINKPGQGVWSQIEMKVKTSPRRQPDAVRVTSREECQASSRCYIEWVVDSSGGSPIREFQIRWRRVRIDYLLLTKHNEIFNFTRLNTNKMRFCLILRSRTKTRRINM
jgi:hypothetical protein